MRWKQPQKHGVQTHHELVNLFLKQVEQLSVIEQLRHRNIIQIIKCPLLCFGALTLTDYKTGLVMFLSQKYEMDQWLKTVGHEIGHSFFFKKSGAHIVRACRCTDTEEDFCDIFSEKWLSIDNNAHETEALLEKHFLNSEKWSYINI